MENDCIKGNQATWDDDHKYRLFSWLPIICRWGTYWASDIWCHQKGHVCNHFYNSYIRALAFRSDWWRQGCHWPSTALIDWLMPIMRKIYGWEILDINAIIFTSMGLQLGILEFFDGSEHEENRAKKTASPKRLTHTHAQRSWVHFVCIHYCVFGRQGPKYPQL